MKIWTEWLAGGAGSVGRASGETWEEKNPCMKVGNTKEIDLLFGPSFLPLQRVRPKPLFKYKYRNLVRSL